MARPRKYGHPLTRQDAPRPYSPRAPFIPLICNGGKSFLWKSARGERLAAYHTEIHRGAPAAGTSPETTTNSKKDTSSCRRKPSRETSFHFEAESSLLPVPAVICVVQLCGRACSGSIRGSQPALLGFALQREGKQLGIAYPW